MKRKALFLVLVAATVCMVAARPVPVPQAIATGELHKAWASVCEHPWYPGLFLVYHLTNGCGDELFLNGDFTPDQVGYDVWAEGILLTTGSCPILEVSEYSVCQPPEPGDVRQD
jgi:hypothetical protein